KPKGTMVHHRGLSNYLLWAVDYYRTKQGEGVPMHGSIAFDATLTSLFTPLLSGKTLYLVSETGIDIEELADTLAGPDQRDWSLVKLTPSHLELLGASIPDDRKAGAARCMVLGGEALTGRTVAPWRTAAPETRIINEYGPTETVVGCAVFEEQ